MGNHVPAVFESTQDAFLAWIASLGVSVWLVAPLLFVVWVAVLWSVKVLLYRKLTRISARTTSHVDDVILYALSKPLAFLVVGSGLLVVERILPAEGADRLMLIGFRLAVVLAGALFSDRLLCRFIDVYADTQPIFQSSRTIARGLSRTLVYALATFAVLDNLGISITPVLASLGVGSLAVALALKDTLANFFAGVQLVADRSVEVGQRVRIESGEEGVVARVGWRSTHIRTAADVLVIVPNSKLTESRITSYDRPTPALSITLEFGVHYDSDLAAVERVALETAREVLRTVPGGEPEAAPAFFCRSFAESAITCILVVRVRSFDVRVPLQHALIVQIQRRFREAGIVMPYPTRTVEFESEPAVQPEARAGRSPVA